MYLFTYINTKNNRFYRLVFTYSKAIATFAALLGVEGEKVAVVYGILSISR